MSKELEPVPRNQSIVQVKIGNRTYPMVRIKNCHTCMHPARILIEDRILINVPFPAIEREFSNKEIVDPQGDTIVWPEISAINIRSHWANGHCSANAEMIRARSEELAEEVGAQYDVTIKKMANHVLVNEAILSRGFERIQRGELEPDIKDTLAAIKLKAEMEKAKLQEVNDSSDQWQQAVRIFFDEVTKILSPEQLDAFKIALRNNKELAQLESPNGVDNDG